MNRRTQQITQGAMIAGLIGVFLLLNRQLAGFFDVYLIWLIPLPFLYYTSEHSFSSGIITAISATLLAFLVSTPATIFYVFGGALIGCVYGWGIQKGKSAGWLLLVAIGGAFIVDFVSTYAFAGFFGYDLNDDIQFMKDFFQKMSDSMGGKVYLPESWNLKYMIYTLILISALMEGVAIHFLAFFIMKRLKKSFPQFKPIDQIKMPIWVSILTILTLGVYIYFARVDLGAQETEIALLCALPLCFVSIFYGYISVIIWFRMHGLRQMNWVVMVLLFIFPMVAMPILGGVGILDGFLDLKKRMIR